MAAGVMAGVRETQRATGAGDRDALGVDNGSRGYDTDEAVPSGSYRPTAPLPLANRALPARSI